MYGVIKAEIERLYKAEIPKHDPQCDFSDGYMCGLSAIENFIESLEKEQPQEPKGLDEAADKYLDTQNVAEMFCGDYEG